jgi:arylformamidase
MATIVDLSHVLADGTVTYPGLPAPVISDHLSRADSHTRYAPGYEFQIGRIDMVSNTGTYLDTPFHRFADGHDLAGLDPARVADVPGVMVDAGDPQEIGPESLDGVEVAGRAVLFRTGWSQHWETPRYGEPDHPYLAAATASRLVAEGAAVVGIDSLNIDGTRNRERPVHTILLEAGIPIIEHMCSLADVGDRPFRFFAVPPAITGMGTFPVRALAFVG